MKLLLFSISIITLVTFSCCSASKKTSNEVSKKSETVMDSKKMLEEGYWEGVVVLSKAEGDCPVTIKIDNKEGSYFLDPINMTEKYKGFIIEGTKVWIKYAGLRMMNRCDKASPVNIVDLKSR